MIRSYKLAALSIIGLLLVCGCRSHENNFARQRQELATTESDAMVDAQDAPLPNIKPSTYFAAGRLHEQNGAIHKAIVQYNQAVAEQPDHVPALSRLGVLYARIGHHQQAEEALRRAVRLQPDSALLRNNLGFELELQKRWGDAEGEFRKAIAIKPDFVRAHINLGMTLAKRGAYAESLVAFAKILPRADALYNLGLMFRSDKRYQDAKRAFEQVLQIDPDFVAARRQIEEIGPKIIVSGGGETLSEESWLALLGEPVTPPVEMIEDGASEHSTAIADAQAPGATGDSIKLATVAIAEPSPADIEVDDEPVKSEIVTAGQDAPTDTGAAVVADAPATANAGAISDADDIAVEQIESPPPLEPVVDVEAIRLLVDEAEQVFEQYAGAIVRLWDRLPDATTIDRVIVSIETAANAQDIVTSELPVQVAEQTASSVASACSEQPGDARQVAEKPVRHKRHPKLIIPDNLPYRASVPQENEVSWAKASAQPAVNEPKPIEQLTLADIVSQDMTFDVTQVYARQWEMSMAPFGGRAVTMSFGHPTPVEVVPPEAVVEHPSGCDPDMVDSARLQNVLLDQWTMVTQHLDAAEAQRAIHDEPDSADLVAADVGSEETDDEGIALPMFLTGSIDGATTEANGVFIAEAEEGGRNAPLPPLFRNADIDALSVDELVARPAMLTGVDVLELPWPEIDPSMTWEDMTTSTSRWPLSSIGLDALIDGVDPAPSFSALLAEPFETNDWFPATATFDQRSAPSEETTPAAGDEAADENAVQPSASLPVLPWELLPIDDGPVFRPFEGYDPRNP